MSTRKTSILNVNDFAPARYAKSRILREAGYEVLEAETGAETLESARRDCPDLILLDVQLPDIDGFEVCRRLKANETTSGIAVLQISAAMVQQRDRVRGLELGADAYLIEPVENEVLLATVRALLRLRSAERALRRATVEWSSTFDAISDGIAVVRNGLISRCNRSFRRVLGVDRCEEASIADLFTNRGVDFAYPDQANLRRQERYAVEVQIDGRWFAIAVDPLRTDVEAEDASVFVIRDVHIHRLAEEQREKLLDSERRARSFAEASRHQSAFLAEASRILGSSEGERRMMEDIAALTVENMCDWCFVDLREGDSPFRTIARAADGEVESALTLHQAVLQGANLRDALTRVLMSGAAEIYPDPDSTSSVATQSSDLSALGASSSICVPISARGTVFGAITVARNSERDTFGANDLHLMQDVAQRIAFAVENRRLFREAQKANRAKDDFLATLSHELRTPLTSALGWTKMLKMGGLDEATVRTALDTIERSTELQSQIIEDILDISRIVTGKLSVNMRETNLAENIAGAVDALRPIAAEKKIEIHASIEPDVPPVVGDHGRLQQIIWNVISNAIKFTPEGGEPIDVRLSRDATDAILTVEDRGEGIPPEFLPHVFDRFRQADSASTREFGGLGLGLAIVRHLVELHHGTVAAFSDGPKRGSRFVVRLPLAPLSPEKANEALQRTWRERKLDGVRVLMLDDADERRHVLASTLGHAGAEVHIRQFADEAFSEVRAWRPHVVVANLFAADDEGHALVDALRRSRKGNHDDVPIIALSSDARADDRERALQDGFAAYLQKPVDPALLATEIARLVEERRSSSPDANSQTR